MIKRILLIFCFCFIHGFVFTTFAQIGVSGFYAHEYVYMSFSYQKGDTFPLQFQVMVEPTDTLVLDVSNTTSFVSSVFPKALNYDECQNENVFYQIYGKRQEVAKAYFLFVNDCYRFFFTQCDKKTYELGIDEKLNVEYLLISGLFANYSPRHNNTIPYIDDDICNRIVNICPFEILMFRKTEEPNVRFSND